MSHNILHWLQTVSAEIEPFQIPLAGIAVALCGAWILIRVCRRPARASARPASHIEMVAELPNLSTPSTETKQYWGISPAGDAHALDGYRPPTAPQQAVAMQPIREVDGELAPAPRARSLNELPDVMDVLATSTWSRAQVASLRSSEAMDTWESPTPPTINARPMTGAPLPNGPPPLPSRQAPSGSSPPPLPSRQAPPPTTAETQPITIDARPTTKEFDVPTLVTPTKEPFDIPTDVYPNEFGLVLLQERRHQSELSPRPRKPKQHPHTVRRPRAS